MAADELPKWLRLVLTVGDMYQPWAVVTAVMLLATLTIIGIYARKPQDTTTAPTGDAGPGLQVDHWERVQMERPVAQNLQYWLSLAQIRADLTAGPKRKDIRAFRGVTGTCGASAGDVEITITSRPQELADGKRFTPNFVGLVVRRVANLVEVVNVDDRDGKARISPSTSNTWTVRDYKAGQSLDLVIVIIADSDEKLAAINNLEAPALIKHWITPSRTTAIATR
jgi:hypothetical protein